METFKTQREAEAHARRNGGVATARAPHPTEGVVYVVLYPSADPFLEDVVRVLCGGGPRIPLPPPPPDEPPT